MSVFEDKLLLRVRYSETDQMGTFYNSRVLEWFECARSEIMRKLGIPYAELEKRGFFLPLIEAHVQYQGRARYDDPLEITTTIAFEGRVKLRCNETIVNAETRRPVACGYTIHAFTNHEGRPQRPPPWFVELTAGKIQAAPPRESE